MRKCPICKKHTGYYYWEATEPGTMERHEYPLYQRTYVVPPREGVITCHAEKGENPISPRCESCYDKAVKNETA